MNAGEIAVPQFARVPVGALPAYEELHARYLQSSGTLVGPTTQLSLDQVWQFDHLRDRTFGRFRVIDIELSECSSFVACGRDPFEESGDGFASLVTGSLNRNPVPESRPCSGEM